jgi:hypothetical protein
LRLSPLGELVKKIEDVVNGKAAQFQFTKELVKTVYNE